jgi:hypothetical protein
VYKVSVQIGILVEELCADFPVVACSHSFSLAAIPVHGQDAKPVSRGAQARVEIYYIELKTVNVQTLADGTTITRETVEIEARDSQGRSIHVTTGPLENGGEFTVGWIDNPLENSQITWDSQRRKLRRSDCLRQVSGLGAGVSDSGNETISYGSRSGPVSAVEKAPPVAIERSVPVPTTAPVSKPGPQHEDLGTTTIQGIEANGERWTTMIPTGEVGNDKPIATFRVN